MKNKIIIISIFFISLFISSQTIFASTSNGTIDPVYRYAWGENVGFIDFGSSAGNIHVTDSALSGSAYGENIGWINLSNLLNDNEGNLSGYAWGENVGFIDFNNVKIETDGVFSGSAYGENIGWISFGTSNNKVSTDWRPLSSRSTHSSGGSSGSIITNPPLTTPPVLNPVLCPAGHLFDINTGQPCITPVINTSSCSFGMSPYRKIKITSPRMTGLDIKDLQICLNAYNFANPLLVVDGVFGSKTKESIINFQKAHFDLVKDGIVGPLTREKIINYLSQ